VLVLAVQNVQVLQTLLMHAQGLHVNAPVFGTAHTFLTWAASQGNHRLLAVGLRHGLDTAARDGNGRCVLEAALHTFLHSGPTASSLCSKAAQKQGASGWRKTPHGWVQVAAHEGAQLADDAKEKYLQGSALLVASRKVVHLLLQHEGYDVARCMAWLTMLQSAPTINDNCNNTIDALQSEVEHMHCPKHRHLMQTILGLAQGGMVGQE